MIFDGKEQCQDEEANKHREVVSPTSPPLHLSKCGRQSSLFVVEDATASLRCYKSNRKVMERNKTYGSAREVKEGGGNLLTDAIVFPAQV